MSTTTKNNSTVDQTNGSTTQATAEQPSSTTSNKISLTSAGVMTTAFLSLINNYSNIMGYLNDLVLKQITSDVQSINNAYDQGIEAATGSRNALWFDAASSFTTAFTAGFQGIYQAYGSSAKAVANQKVEVNQNKLDLLAAKEHLTNPNALAQEHVMEAGRNGPIDMDARGGNQEVINTVATRFKNGDFLKLKDPVTVDGEARAPTAAEIRAAAQQVHDEGEGQRVIERVNKELDNNAISEEKANTAERRLQNSATSYHDLLNGLIGTGLSFGKANYDFAGKSADAAEKQTLAIKNFQDQSIQDWMQQLNAYASKQTSVAGDYRQALATASRA